MLAGGHVRRAWSARGRRIEKKVWEYDSGWSLTRHCKFLYDGWLLLLELDGADSDAVVRKYTCGRDLGGLQGRGTARGRAALSQAGGIGGLLAVYDADEDEDYVYFHDALGNVGQVVDLGAATASAAMMVKYEYDPLRQPDEHGDAGRIRAALPLQHEVLRRRDRAELLRVPVLQRCAGAVD